MKRYVRQRTDQQYSTMLSLIEESRDHFVEIQLYKKLFRLLVHLISMDNRIKIVL